MNQTLYAVLNFLRGVAANSEIKTSRGYADFLADRIVQSATKRTLLGFAESMLVLMDVNIDGINAQRVKEFLEAAQSDDANGVLSWLRQQPKIAALLATRRDDKVFEDAINTIEIKSVDELGVAKPAPNGDINIIVTCTSPLAHGADTKAGNATLFRRMDVLSTTGQVLSLPFYAGNAVRGQVRDLLAFDFIKRVLDGKKAVLKTWMYHALFSGGALEENSAAAAAIGKQLGNNGAVIASGITRFRDMIPPLSILGTALGNRIINGRVNFHDLHPICREWGSGEISVGELMCWVYLTRREDDENHPADEKSAAMIANTECLKEGAILLGSLDVSEHITAIEQSCLDHGLWLLQDAGTLGAEKRRGLGRVKIEYDKELDSKAYIEYLESNKQEIINYLQELGALNDGD